MGIKFAKTSFFFVLIKNLDFSTNSAFSHYYHYLMCSKICSFDPASKTASNDIGWALLAFDMVRKLLSIRRHPKGTGGTMPKKLQLSLGSSFIL